MIPKPLSGSGLVPAVGQGAARILLLLAAVCNHACYPEHAGVLIMRANNERLLQMLRRSIIIQHVVGCPVGTSGCEPGFNSSLLDARAPEP